MIDAEYRLGDDFGEQPRQHQQRRFNILDYIKYLTPDGGSETKGNRSFLCPLCGTKNFKVELKTGKYNTYGCGCMEIDANKKRIVRLLVEQSGSQKLVRPEQQRFWSYRDAAGKIIIVVYRLDDGHGKRRFWQKPAQAGSPSELRKLVRPYRYQECLAAIERGELVFWVEGESCADALNSIGLTATTTIQGSNSYSSEQYAGLFPAESLVICPDRDQQGLKYAKAIAADYPAAKWCYANPDSILWQHLSASGGWDIADWIAEGATAEMILAAVEDQRSLSAPALAPKEDTKNSEFSGTAKPNPFKRKYHAIEQLYPNRLRFNEFTKEIELDTKPVDLSNFRVKLAVFQNLDVRFDHLNEILTHLAKQNSFHPVKDYLRRCADQNKDTQVLDNLAWRYFGCTNPIHNTFLKRTLIGAVARAFEPGCKMDTALILQGKQGYGKSTFFKLLAGEDFFDDSLGAIDKDEKLKLHQTWFAEWAELESVFKRRDISFTKAFISSSTDVLRPPYGKQPVRMKRQSIIVGTTNQDEFLNDSTGNRRFWVIPVQQRIDIAQVQQERDRIWGAAVVLYQAGEAWWLTAAEEQQAQNLAKEYLTTDPWQSRIEAHLIEWRLSMVTTNEVLNNCLEIDARQQNRGHQMRVAECLKRLGWESTQKKYQGKRQRVWKPQETASTPQLGSNATSERDTTLVQPVEQQVDTLQNGEITKVLEDSDQPEQPQTSSFIYFDGHSNGHGAFSARQLE